MSICPRCGTSFECGMADPSGSNEPCWCTQLPVLSSSAYLAGDKDGTNLSCFCPHCLRALLDAQEKSSGTHR